MANNEVDSAIQRLLKLGIKVTKLWENASPNSTFKSQSINVNLDDGDAVLIKGRYADTNDKLMTIWGYVGNTCEMVRVSIDNSKSYTSRVVNVTKTTIKFNEGRIVPYNGSSSQNDAVSIPVEVFGIKLLGGVQLKAYLRRFFAALQRGCRSCVV